MICPICKKGETSVVDSRPTEDGTSIRRRRLCVCGQRFTTFERVQFRELTVIKKNGRKSQFDREKLAKSIFIALKKRPLDTETIGIVLGNPNFWDEAIIGKESTNENVHQVREYFQDLFGMEDHSIIPSQFWFFNEGISSRDFKAIFDPTEKPADETGAPPSCM